MNDIVGEANIAAVAELIGDPSRAAMLNALMDQHALAAGELARSANISPQTASTHLAKLVEGGLLTLTPQGRHRYYMLANAEVAHALEALAIIAPPVKIRSLRESLIVQQLRIARTCYDHLAGRLGVELTQALLDTKTLQLEEQYQRYTVTEEGADLLTQFGIDLEKLRRQRRSFARPCLDWSERRYHLAGALGVAFNEHLLQLGWIEKTPSGRAVQLTKNGYAGLQRMLGTYFRFCE